MRRLLSAVFPRASAKALRSAALLTLLLVLVAHGFCFTNLTYSGASVMLNAAKGSSAQISSGAFLLPIYWRIRGAIASPLWVGLLSAAYLSLASSLICGLLNLSSPYLIAMLSGAMALSPSVLAAFAGSIHTADSLFLAVLLAVCAVVLCLRVRAGALLGALVLAGAQALDRCALAFFLSLTALCLLRSLLSDDEEAPRAVDDSLLPLAHDAERVAERGGVVVLYGGGFLLFLRRFGLDLEASLQAPAGKGLVGAWLYPFRLLFQPLTIYTHVGAVLHALLIALGAFAFFKLLPRLKGRAPAAALLVLLFPLLINLPAFSTLPADQTSMPYALLDVLLIILLQAAFEFSIDERHLAYRLGSVALGVALLGTTFFANQVYLKKALEFDSTLSVMTRVIARAEAEPEFELGTTPVALVGSIEDSDVSVVHEGFEKLDVLDVARNNYAAVDDEGNTWYMWEVMGYPFNLVDTFTLGQLAARDDVQGMPAFPAEGCCQMLDGTLVIKLSDIEQEVF